MKTKYEDICYITVAFADISLERKGDGGESIYGPTFEGKHYMEANNITYWEHTENTPFTFADESFAVCHSKRGILGMANKGPHTNGSQFYITLQPTQWMDKTYVAFGFVVR